MVTNKKLIGYYISSNKCLKSYNFYDKKKHKYIKKKKLLTVER